MKSIRAIIGLRLELVLHETRIFVYIFGMTEKTPTVLQPPVYSALKLFDFIPEVCLFVKNRNSEFIYANPAFLAMLGARTLAEILGKTDHDFSPRELADRFVRDDRQVMRTRKPISSRVELVPNYDDIISWHITTKIPIQDEEGEVVGLAGMTRDLNRTDITAGRYKEMAGVMRHMEDHFPEPVTVKDLAAIAHLSLSQFERRFKALFQVTPVQYLIRLRLNKACQILTSTPTKITDIATQCGFYDHSHFIRQFSKAFGLAPSAYRRQHQ
jgi:AraC-like DNA-binding protein